MIRPRNDHIVVDRLRKNEATLSGIILAHQDPARPYTGRVLSVGPDVKDIKVGQTVHYSRLSGHVVRFGDQTRLMLRHHDILAFE